MVFMYFPFRLRVMFFVWTFLRVTILVVGERAINRFGEGLILIFGVQIQGKYSKFKIGLEKMPGSYFDKTQKIEV